MRGPFAPTFGTIPFVLAGREDLLRGMRTKQWAQFAR